MPGEIAFIAWCVLCATVFIMGMMMVAEEGLLVSLLALLVLGSIITLITAFVYEMLIVRMP